jgi:hypothetical protein
MLMMKKTKNLEFEPVHPKNLLLASVVIGISCLFSNKLIQNRRIDVGKLKSVKSKISDIKRSSLTKIIDFTSPNRGIYGFVPLNEVNTYRFFFTKKAVYKNRNLDFCTSLI